MDITAMINRRITGALNALRQPFRATLARITTKGGVQTAQFDGVADETLQALEVFQHFGFTSVPPAGAMAIVVPVGGRTSHGIVVATEHSQYRIQGLQSGEVAIYTSEGASITLKMGKIIDVECDEFNVNCKKFSVVASTDARFDTPQLTATQKATVMGLFTGQGGMSITGDNGGGNAASFTGSVLHTGGTITSDSIKINGVELGTHKHNTHDGPSDGPQN
jgi:phage baseplate assembly protein V